jgi:hypothetical protein
MTEEKRIYPMMSLENAELLNAQGLLLFGMPGDFAFSGKDMFKELPYPSAQYFVKIVTQSRDCGRERAYPSHLVEDVIAN